MLKSDFPLISIVSSVVAKSGCWLAVRFVLSVGILVSAASYSIADTASEPRQSVKILTIGNSFSNDAIEQLPAMAKAGGKKLVLGRTSLGGCSLERHAKHLAAALRDPESKEARPYAYHAVFGKELAKRKTVTLPEALASQQWDFVTIQEWSARSFKPEYQEPYAMQLIEAIRKYAPTAEILIHQTWAYREDHPWYQKGEDGLTQQKMYDGLRAAYIDMANRYGLRLIPSGAAIQAARQTPRWTYKPDANFDFKNAKEGELPDQAGSLNTGWRWAKQKNGTMKFSLDAIHCNTAGRYLGACAFYETIYNDSVPPATAFVPSGLSVEDAAGLREIAHQSVLLERQRMSQISKQFASQTGAVRTGLAASPRVDPSVWDHRTRHLALSSSGKTIPVPWMTTLLRGSQRCDNIRMHSHIICVRSSDNMRAVLRAAARA